MRVRCFCKAPLFKGFRGLRFFLLVRGGGSYLGLRLPLFPVPLGVAFVRVLGIEGCGLRV